MDQKKIGKFISEKRKELKLTQAQLAEKLGVTDKTVSRWENGNYMPDLSLLQQLSKELNVSINELLSGEKVSKEDYQQKFEENIISTIDYSNKKLDSVKTIIAVISTIFSIIVLLAFNLITVFADLDKEVIWLLNICASGMVGCAIVQFLLNAKKHQKVIVFLAVFLITLVFTMLIRNVI